MTKSVTGPWMGRILHVDLTTGAIETVSSWPYVEDYMGGRGFAARLAWDRIPPGMRPFDAEAPLFFMPGALVGTPAPSSGRLTVCGLSPQAHPHEWYTRASLGGHWGATLKYAGYDGLFVTGEASEPVYLAIDGSGGDGPEVEIRPARHLWGKGLVETQLSMRDELGAAWRVLAIGPAGENRCRYAIIATGTESAAGQGGFGAVMGSKQLKAIAIRSDGGQPRGVTIAQPREMLRRSRLVMRRIQQRYPEQTTGDQATPIPRGQRPSPCTYQCPRSCGTFVHDAPGAVHPERRYSGQVFCCSPRFAGGEWLGAELDADAAFEISQVSNDLGINHWELTFGLVPWILRCQQRGELLSLDGERFDFSSASFWLGFLERIARREGWGDLLAEGTPRVAETLGIGQDLVSEFYPAWGQASHWDGHGSFGIPYYPYWLVTSLQWALDTRDPLGGGHGYTTNIYGLMNQINPDAGDDAFWRRLATVGQALYGSALAIDPRSDYEDKEIPAVRHQDLNALKDSLGICDNIFPLWTDPGVDDYLVSVDGVGGPSLEHYMFEPVSDLGLSREDFYRIGTRVFTLERLLGIRNWGRSRGADESVISYLQHPEGTANPYLAHTVDLDLDRFRALLDRVYDLRGWDAATGQPTSETVRDLGLHDLVSGNRRSS